MKFLLINLDWPGLVSKRTYKIHLSLPPLDLILLQERARKAGHEAVLLDCFVEAPGAIEAKAFRASAEADWLIIATTPYHMWQCPNSEWGWLKQAIAKFPAEKVVLTGLHASVFPERTLRETGVHAVIRREPEASFGEFLQKGRWSECRSISVLDDGRYIENPWASLPPMDELAVENYDVPISKYGYFLLGKRTGIFEASRGCPWKCTFCDQEMYSWSYRTKSAAAFSAEVLRAVEHTGMQTAYFYDLEFTVSKPRTIEICEELLRCGVSQKLRWCCQTRADTVNEEVIDALIAAGCKLIHFGVESANPEVLKATNKKITVEKIERGVRLAKARGLQTACFFMFGLPEESPEQFETTLEFARSLNPTYASFHFAIPFPGTPLYKLYLEKNGLEWGVWPATYFEGWPNEAIQQYLKRAYRKFYLMPKRFEMRRFLERLDSLPAKLTYFLSLNS